MGSLPDVCRSHSLLVLLYFIIYCSSRASLFNDLEPSCYLFVSFLHFPFFDFVSFAYFLLQFIFSFVTSYTKRTPPSPIPKHLKFNNPPSPQVRNVLNVWPLSIGQAIDFPVVQGLLNASKLVNENI